LPMMARGMAKKTDPKSMVNMARIIDEFCVGI